MTDRQWLAVFMLGLFMGIGLGLAGYDELMSLL